VPGRVGGEDDRLLKFGEAALERVSRPIASSLSARLVGILALAASRNSWADVVWLGTAGGGIGNSSCATEAVSLARLVGVDGRAAGVPGRTTPGVKGRPEGVGGRIAEGVDERVLLDSVETASLGTTGRFAPFGWLGPKEEVDATTFAGNEAGTARVCDRGLGCNCGFGGRSTSIASNLPFATVGGDGACSRTRFTTLGRSTLSMKGMVRPNSCSKVAKSQRTLREPLAQIQRSLMAHPSSQLASMHQMQSK
jgi:hypothetical protein